MRIQSSEFGRQSLDLTSEGAAGAGRIRRPGHKTRAPHNSTVRTLSEGRCQFMRSPCWDKL